MAMLRRIPTYWSLNESSTDSSVIFSLSLASSTETDTTCLGARLNCVEIRFEIEICMLPLSRIGGVSTRITTALSFWSRISTSSPSPVTCGNASLLSTRSAPPKAVISCTQIWYGPRLGVVLAADAAVAAPPEEEEVALELAAAELFVAAADEDAIAVLESLRRQPPPCQLFRSAKQASEQATNESERI